MSNQFGFLSDETFAEKMDTQNKFLAAILSAQGGSVVPTSFKDVQTLVRSGLASKVFHIGDQLVCNKGDVKLVWDIIGINQIIINMINTRFYPYLFSSHSFGTNLIPIKHSSSDSCTYRD